MEDALTRRALQSPSDDGQNTTTSGNVPELPWSVADWQNAATDVNRGLIDIWINQNKQAQEVAEDKAGAPR